jgi:hypothetical protein
MRTLALIAALSAPFLLMGAIVTLLIIIISSQQK